MVIMKNLFALVLIFLAETTFSQKPEYLQLTPYTNAISNSFFSNIEVVDTRFDTVYMGFVQKGAFNRKAPIQLPQPLAITVEKFTSALIANASKQNGTVLINIRNLFLSEAEKATAETGTLIFEAACYYKTNDRYDLMFTVDTTITLKSGWDVTKKLESKASEQLSMFVKRAAGFDKNNLQQTAYSYNDIEQIDDVEKRSIPVYNVDLPKKGLYASFETFKNNQPSDTNFIVQYSKKGSPDFYTIQAGETRGKSIKTKDYYAICDGNQLYISTRYGIYPLTKKKNDFYFIGKGKEAADAAVFTTAYLMFGILGGLMASIPESATFEFKIDYSTGNFLPIKKIK